MSVARSLLLMNILFTLLYAQQDTEQFPFIGITAETHTIDFSSVAGVPKEKENSFGIRYGKQTKEWRTLFAFSGNDGLKTFSMEVDKILLDGLFGMPEIRPYLGATLGYLRYQNDTVSDNSGHYYGGNFGFLLYATDSVDLDLSYHYHSVSGVEPLDTMRGASLSLHYFF